MENSHHQNHWTPAPEIVVKVLALIYKGASLLACPIFEYGEFKGIRPIGGTIKFGETKEEALKREIKEELNLTTKIIEDWMSFENIYHHENKIGHEYIFVAEVEFLSLAALNKEHFDIIESDGQHIKAQWYALEEIINGKLTLFPEGLKDKIFYRKKACP